MLHQCAARADAHLLVGMGMYVKCDMVMEGKVSGCNDCPYWEKQLRNMVPDCILDDFPDGCLECKNMKLCVTLGSSFVLKLCRSGTNVGNSF